MLEFNFIDYNFLMLLYLYLIAYSFKGYYKIPIQNIHLNVNHKQY
jgi:hypothetical protein